MTEPGWRVVVGSDDAGLEFKERLKQDLEPWTLGIRQFFAELAHQPSPASG